MYIAIFDDEEFIVSSISKIIKDYMSDIAFSKKYEIKAFSTEIDFNNFCCENSALIYFIDISTSRNEKYGIEIAKEIRKKCLNSYIVFITAYDEYIKDAVSEMIRPLNYISKVNMECEILNTLKNIVFELEDSDKYIALVQDKKKYYEKSDNIIYAKYNSQIRKTEVHLENDSIIYIIDSLQKLSTNLPTSFLKINRNTLVNIDKISNINFYKNFLILDNCDTFKISRNNKKELQQKLKELRNFQHSS